MGEGPAFSFAFTLLLREKQIKKWRREEKIALIEKRNPTWVDLTVEMPVSAKK
jgi:predicted GIY-YIG superfamily endonuclease